MSFYFKLYYRLRSGNNAVEGDNNDEDEPDDAVVVEDDDDDCAVDCFCGKLTCSSVVVVVFVVGLVGFVPFNANEGYTNVDGINADGAVLFLLSCWAYS